MLCAKLAIWFYFQGKSLLWMKRSFAFDLLVVENAEENTWNQFRPFSCMSSMIFAKSLLCARCRCCKINTCRRISDLSLGK
uniref:Putative secreted protein n=1 Tax=Anopheles darlingi TaxID=43151 RepID=A0A2M4DQR5_ANODA